jgi:hypothetical protein
LTFKIRKVVAHKESYIHISLRISVWKRLGFDPGSGRRGANGARHACVAINRKRRKLTPDERAVEADEAKRRISSVKMAETVYG